ncbi:hypothetical protein BN1184_CF_00780 [Pantoea ananatis]|nr:hypothetical protein BN1184_CF_00780 [Pantoea ananatis]
MPTQSASAETAYDKLLSAARVLFYNHGINGTGIDAIVKRAGVAKKAYITTLPLKMSWSRFISGFVTRNGLPCTKIVWTLP